MSFEHCLDVHFDFSQLAACTRQWRFIGLTMYLSDQTEGHTLLGHAAMCIGIVTGSTNLIALIGQKA